MKKVPEDYVLNLMFRDSMSREEMLIKKYDALMSDLRSDDLRDMFIDFKKNSHDHINMMKDKIIQLNLQE